MRAATTDPLQLARLAVDELMTRTGAQRGGFLGLDPENPHQRLVLPDGDELENVLSRRLTRLVRERDRRVWIYEDFQGAPTDGSLDGTVDALCLPVRVGSVLLGNIHLYRDTEPFTNTDLKFALELVDRFAPRLRDLNQWRNLSEENARLRRRFGGTEELIGNSKRIQELRCRIEQIAPLSHPVLIEGETGTGKDLVALLIHQHSGRLGPFVHHHSTGFQHGLVDVQLFGRRDESGELPGLFERAEGGTLYLDEVAELPIDVQGRLLMVLDGHMLNPSGTQGIRMCRPDFRVVASTTRDLRAEVAANRFLPELLFRLQQLPMVVPPLRDHREDIPDLVHHLMARFEGAIETTPRQISPAAMQRLNECDWPGNVRQLESVLRVAIISSEGRPINQKHIRLDMWDFPFVPNDPPLDMDGIRSWAVRRALSRNGGNQTRAAEELGITTDTLRAIQKRVEGDSPR